MIFSALIAAIALEPPHLVVRYSFLLPRTLLGGFMGAALAHVGHFAQDGHSVINYSVVIPIFLFIFGAPLLGMLVSLIITLIIVNICRRANPYKADSWFRRLQLVSSALFSLGHGSNDAQKVLGLIAAAMVAQGQIESIKDVPDWVPLACFTAIAIGTMSGGWKIVKTMGSRITKVTPLEGVAAETAGAATLFLTEHLGIPVSTTTYHYWRHHGCGCNQTLVCSALGRYHQPVLGLDPHHSGEHDTSRDHLLYYQAGITFYKRPD